MGLAAAASPLVGRRTPWLRFKAVQSSSKQLCSSTGLQSLHVIAMSIAIVLPCLDSQSFQGFIRFAELLVGQPANRPNLSSFLSENATTNQCLPTSWRRRK